MIKMRHILTCIALTVLTVNTAFSQKRMDEELQPKDPVAKGILDQVSKKNKEIKSAYIRFTHILDNKADDIHEENTGKLWLKGDMYKVVLGSVERFCDGKTLWTYMKDDDEVQVNNANTGNEGGFQPSKLLNIYEKGFNYKFIQTTEMDSKSLDVIALYPEKADKPYHTIKLYITNKKTIYAIEIKGKDGNTYTYKIKSMEKNPDLPEGTFMFDESKAGDVIDLRE